jgi:hypothetical protein
MANKFEVLEEADSRGLLKGEKKIAYDEAVSRGLYTPTKSANAEDPVAEVAEAPQSNGTLMD